jgi:hypothetical protein
MNCRKAEYAPKQVQIDKQAPAVAKEPRVQYGKASQRQLQLRCRYQRRYERPCNINSATRPVFCFSSGSGEARHFSQATTYWSANVPESQAHEKALRPHSKRRKARSFLRKWKQISFKHTWINPLILTLIVLSAYAVNPTESNPFHKAIFLSYALPPDHRYPLDPPKPPHRQDGPTMYGKGPHDITFVAFYTIVLSFTREFLMQRLIRPLALYCGVRSRNKQSRFMEV